MKHLGKTESTTIKFISEDSNTKSFLYDLPDISSNPVKVQLVYRQIDNRILLAWDVSIELKSEPHWWNIRVNALNGDFIDKNDYTVNCQFDESLYEHADEDPVLSSTSDNDCYGR